MRLDHPLYHGYRLTCCTELRATLLIGRSIDVKQSMHLQQFALIYTYSSYIMNKCKQKKHGKDVYMTYIYVFKASYMHICPAYRYIWQNITLYTAHTIYIYIYIYMQHKTLNNHAQATDTAGSSSQHSITIYQSPPEAIEGFCLEISR